MPSMDQLAYAMQMRDIVDKMVVEKLDKERPKYRYATVVSVDRASRKANVIFNGETSAVQVNMGAIQPTAAGQIVRIEGNGTDKFIADVVTNYDTGWKSITPAAGFTINVNFPIRIRKIGIVVYLEGILLRSSGDFAAATEYTIFSLPSEEFQPAGRPYISLSGAAVNGTPSSLVHLLVPSAGLAVMLRNQVACNYIPLACSWIVSST